jgi:hypothetical protein
MALFINNAPALGLKKWASGFFVPIGMVEMVVAVPFNSMSQPSYHPFDMARLSSLFLYRQSLLKRLISKPRDNPNRVMLAMAVTIDVKAQRISSFFESPQRVLFQSIPFNVQSSKTFTSHFSPIVYCHQ